MFYTKSNKKKKKQVCFVFSVSFGHRGINEEYIFLLFP